MEAADSGKYSVSDNILDDKDLPLREDIRFLGRMLGDTLREQEGDDAFELVENIRQTAIRFHRDQDPIARQELDTLLKRLSDDDSLPVVRAFSYFSLLSNIAEDVHHNRRRRAHRRDVCRGDAGRQADPRRRARLKENTMSDKKITLHDMTLRDGMHPKRHLMSL